MAPYTFTFDDIGSNARSAVGTMGSPSGLPTENGCGACGCCASDARGRMPTTSAMALTREMTRLMCALRKRCCGKVAVFYTGAPGHPSRIRKTPGAGHPG